MLAECQAECDQNFDALNSASVQCSTYLYEHGGRRSIAGIKESFEGYRPPTPMVIKEIPFKFSTCKTSAGVIKEIHYKMQHVQD